MHPTFLVDTREYHFLAEGGNLRPGFSNYPQNFRGFYERLRAKKDNLVSLELCLMISSSKILTNWLHALNILKTSGQRKNG